MSTHPRLTVSIQTKNSESRLPRLLSEVASFADEIVVGVDASSTDETLRVATEGAHIVYRYTVSHQLAPARRLVFQYATGDWIFSLDDDESIEDSFNTILPELLNTPNITHVLFPRKWITSIDPCKYLYAPLWYPDWQMRLFRNDPTRVHKPALIHSGYWAQGVAHHETRCALLHYERVLCSEEERLKKLEHYRVIGSTSFNDAQYVVPAETLTRPAFLRTITGATPENKAILHPVIHKLDKASVAPWGCNIRALDMPGTLDPGETGVVEFSVKNTGRLSWTPEYGRMPLIRLGYHLLNSAGEVLEWEKGKYPLPCAVNPGEEAKFIITLVAPDKSGDYILEWDMVSESECWFYECGSQTLRLTLHVNPTREELAKIARIQSRSRFEKGIRRLWRLFFVYVLRHVILAMMSLTGRRQT